MRRNLWVIWCCFLLRGVFCCSVLPLWEGFDEYSHFALIQHLAWTKQFPDFRTANTSEAVAASLKLVPVPWMIHDAASGRLSYEEYWKLSAEQRTEQQYTLRHLPLTYANQGAQPPLALYEAQQAPLYYWMCAVLYWPMRAVELPTQVWVLRCFTVLIASLAIPLAFLASRKVFRDEGMAVAIALVIASMPELLLSVSRVSNEGLAVALGSLVILLALRFVSTEPTVKQGIFFGLAIGCALLCKAYFLALLPWAAVVCWFAHKQKALRFPLATSLTCLLVAGFWYGRTFHLTGSFTGEQSVVIAQTVATPSLVQTAGQISWRPVFDFLATSHIWLGNWSFLVARSWMYQAIKTLWLLSGCGIVVQFIKPRHSLGSRKQLFLLVLPYFLFIPGLCYHALQTFRISGAAGSMGYYLYCMAEPEAMLLVIGLARLLPPRWGFMPVPLLVTLFLALEFFGNWFLLLPYYTGLIQHDAHHNLPAFHPTAERFQTLLERLPVNKPYFLHTPEIAGLVVLSLLASGVLLGLSVRLMTSNSDPGFDTARLRQGASR